MSSKRTTIKKDSETQLMRLSNLVVQQNDKYKKLLGVVSNLGYKYNTLLNKMKDDINELQEHEKEFTDILKELNEVKEGL